MPHTLRSTMVIVFIMLMVSSVLYGRSALKETLADGSIWKLNVDGEEDVLKFTGGRGRPTADGGWAINMEVTWGDRGGVLSAKSDGENTVQEVSLTLTTRDGQPIRCEGYMSQHTDSLMAGTTRSVDQPAFPGAWFAQKIFKTSAPRELIPARPTIDTPSDGVIVAPSPEMGDRIKEVQPIDYGQPGDSTSTSRKATCRVSGKITGETQFAKYVTAYDLANGGIVHQATLDGNKEYRFYLCPGRYLLRVATGGTLEVVATPQNKEIQCTDNGNIKMVFHVTGISEG